MRSSSGRTHGVATNGRPALPHLDPFLSAEQAAETAIEAYVYGYPLVLMDVTRQVATAAASAGAERAPINQFVHRREFPGPAFTQVVSPNADTLYSTAWLDLTKGPIVLSLPATERYYLMPLLDAWTNVFSSLGPRTTGSDARDFAILGPRWRGRLLMGVPPIVAPTNMVWLLGRTEARGAGDCAAVHALQDRYRLTPMSAWGTAYVPPCFVPVARDVDLETPPPVQVARMDAATFFGRLNALMKDNPPAPADARAVEQFAAIGVAPGRPLDFASLDPVVADALAQSVPAAQAIIGAVARGPNGRSVNGWQMTPQTGAYGTDYLRRAAVALVGLGANLPEDAVYPRATADAEGRPLTGAHRYALRFTTEQIPPVGAFWSLTLYDAKRAFVPNPLGRHAIGSRDPLAAEDDGSLTLYIQHRSPGARKESNWLPAPRGSFNLVMRLYWPGKRVLDRSWEMPPLERVH